MMTDYYYYRLACEAKKVRALTNLRFEIAYARFQRDKARSSQMIAAEVDPRKRLRMAARWTRLAKVDAYVHRGRILAGDDGPDLVAAGFGAIPPDDKARVALSTAVGKASGAADMPAAQLRDTAPESSARVYDLDRPASSIRTFPRHQDDGPFPDAGAPGVREPRRPVSPPLIGAAAKSPPNAAEPSPRQELFSTAV